MATMPLNQKLWNSVYIFHKYLRSRSRDALAWLNQKFRASWVNARCLSYRRCICAPLFWSRHFTSNTTIVQIKKRKKSVSCLPKARGTVGGVGKSTDDAVFWWRLPLQEILRKILLRTRGALFDCYGIKSK